MLILPISKELEKKIQEIIDNRGKEYFYFRAHMYSSKNPEMHIELDRVARKINEQCFNKRLTADYFLDDDPGLFTDDINMEVIVTPREYMLMIANRQDLFVNIQLVYVDPETHEEITNKPPLIFQYRCSPEDNEDITKKYNISMIEPDEDQPVYEGHEGATFSIWLTLIHDQVYRVRHSKVNTIFSGNKRPLTVTKVLRYLTQVFGINNIHMIDADNDYNYKHIIIPTPMGINSVFDYIQEEYGVYNKGFCYFFTNDTLYIYPPYETQPEEVDSTVHIYNALEGTYIGLQGYHMYQGKDIHIVSNSPVDTKNITDMGLENTGNAITHIRADRMIDKFSDTSESKSYIHDDNLSNVELNKQSTLREDALNTSYKKPAINTYKYTSELAKNDATFVVTRWDKCKPNSIYPGQRVKYHYDEKGKYSTKLGKVEYVKYEYIPEERKAEEVYMSCSAVLMLRLETD